MIAPGDILITLRTCGDLRRGDVVTVSHTSPSGEYVYLDETDGKIASRADAFMVAVKRPWHAWADPEWETKARAAAERFVREGIVVGAAPVVACTATIGPDSDDPHVYHCDRKTPHRYQHSTGPEGEEIAWWCSCPDCASHRDSDLTTAPVATEAERDFNVHLIPEAMKAAIRTQALREAADHFATEWSGHYVKDVVDALRSLAEKETER